MYTHLKERSYYEDLYDDLTIKDCKSFEKSHKTDLLKPGKYPECKLTPKEERQAKKFVYNLAMWQIKGDHADNRLSTIQKWIERDTVLDALQDNAIAPDILCMKCGIYMDEDSRMLDHRSKKKEDEVHFIMRCEECRTGQCVRQDGTEVIFEHTLCPNCKTKTQDKTKRTKKAITTIRTCNTCDYKNEYKYDLTVKKDPVITDQKIRQRRIDKAKYCLNDKDLSDFREAVANMKNFSETMKRFEKNKDRDKVVKALKTVSIIAIEKRIRKVLKKI